MITYTIEVHPEDESLWAKITGYPGCYATGDTLPELLRNLAEAAELYVADPYDG